MFKRAIHGLGGHTRVGVASKKRDKRGHPQRPTALQVRVYVNSCALSPSLRARLWSRADNVARSGTHDDVARIIIADGDGRGDLNIGQALVPPDWPCCIHR